jgi:hypothetical protein
LTKQKAQDDYYLEEGWLEWQGSEREGSRSEEIDEIEDIFEAEESELGPEEGEGDEL